MKKEFQRLVREMGYEARYSGNTRTMYIHGVLDGHHRITALASTMNVPFKVEFQKQPPLF